MYVDDTLVYVTVNLIMASACPSKVHLPSLSFLLYLFSTVKYI